MKWLIFLLIITAIGTVAFNTYLHGRSLEPVVKQEQQQIPKLFKQTGTTVVALHFDAWHDWHDSYRWFLSLPQARYVNRVAVSAGRADWTYFRWKGNQAWWSSDQMASREDMLEHTIKVLKDHGYATTAIFDVYGSRYLQRNPDAAAQDIYGNKSKSVICSTELAEGEAGKHLVSAVDALAATTQADTVSITELFYDKHCYDDRCLYAYEKATGHADWPRTPDGTINYLDPSIGDWRSQQVASIVARLAHVIHMHGKKFALDVKVSRGDISNDSRENGQDYELLAPYVDEFVVWDYFATEGKTPESAVDVARYFKDKFGADRFYLSIGMWGEQKAISADMLSRGLHSAYEGGATKVWVTPAEMMSAAHWQALAESVKDAGPVLNMTSGAKQQ